MGKKGGGGGYIVSGQTANSWKKCGFFFFWHPIARATIYCLLPDTFLLLALKNAPKAGTVNFANSLSPPSIVKKVRTGSKNSQGYAG